MKYYCNKCKTSYTIPIGDQMMNKNINCNCGEDPKKFEITDNIIFLKFPESLMLIKA